MEWLEMAGSGWNGLKLLQMAGMAEIGWKWLKRAENGLKRLEMAGMAENCWKWLVIAGTATPQPDRVKARDAKTHIHTNFSFVCATF